MEDGVGGVSFGYAATGDTNIDRQVDIIDAANFLAGGTFDTGVPARWTDGDFTYDGLTDILDAAGFLSTGLYDAGLYTPPATVAENIAAPSGAAGQSRLVRLPSRNAV